jgi:hypothetical protein
MGRSAGGSPALVSAVANPNPCNNPKANATTHGWRIVKLVSPRHERTLSGTMSGGAMPSCYG